MSGNDTVLSTLMFPNTANSGPVCLICLADCKASESSTRHTYLSPLVVLQF
jgi:hypothetical protein